MNYIAKTHSLSPIPAFVFSSIITLFIAGCAVVPTVHEEYDADCKIVKKKIELTVEQMNAFKHLHCSGNHDCKSAFLGQIAGAALLLPVSAVVSGSIAVVGNSMYWLIEQGKCSSTDEEKAISDEKKPKLTT